MASDQAQRTEEPTPRRKEKAREEGQIPSSREFTAAAQFSAAILMLYVYGGAVTGDLKVVVAGLFREAFQGDLTVERLRLMVLGLLRGPLEFMGIYAVVLVVIGACWLTRRCKVFVLHIHQVSLHLANPWRLLQLVERRVDLHVNH